MVVLLPDASESAASVSPLNQPYQISSSPPTGATSMVALSSSSASTASAVLSPLGLREELPEPNYGPERPVPTASWNCASSDSPSPRRLASGSAQLSGSDNSLPPSVTINVVHHIHHHIHHHAHRNGSESEPNEENFNSLSSQMAAFGLSQDNYVSRAADPRSPLRQPGLVPTPLINPSQFIVTSSAVTENVNVI
ncbi:hypothetical protein K438DRAFT_2011724 [Mycena galopus ATCC 62051]|nr:hypothetical protein K438DRAFT_2011724 [Mycena galopus ATCC 62051]